MYKKLNQDEIKLLRLLADAYNFANISDVHSSYAEDDGSSAKYKGNYETMEMVNELNPRIVSSVCNPISKAVISIIGEELHEYWINGSNYDVDELIKITNSEGV